jgi:uncharacterized protein
MPFHLMLKPSGADCNLACRYCYYLEKTRYYPEGQMRMDEEALEHITRSYLQTNPAREVVFGWQGGEPLLMGIEFFQKALEFQKRYIQPGQTVQNALQTNATLINDEWADFFNQNNFLIGISIDGPAELHDRYRLDRGGQPTYHRVQRGVEILMKHSVECNALTTVNHINSRHPLKVYNHLKTMGFKYLQFIPIVERESFATRDVTPWTVNAKSYGDFLCTIFDEWLSRDAGDIFIQIIESAMNVVLGGYPSLCVFTPTCGRAMAIEHNGDLYSCDHFVYPKYLLGNVHSENMADMANGQKQITFGQKKADIPMECRRCSVLKYCYGDCPKHRFRVSSDGKNISYLCSAYRRFFTHCAPSLIRLAQSG